MNKISREYLMRFADILNYLEECFRQIERGDIDSTLEDIQNKWRELSEKTYLIGFHEFEVLSRNMLISAGMQGQTPADPDLQRACLEIGFLMRQISIAMQGESGWQKDELAETIRLESLSDDDYFAEIDAKGRF